MVNKPELIHSLQLYSSNKLIFHSNGKWLHPLFEMEDFLQKNKEFDNLFLMDKIAGRAAAFLMVRMGIKKCHIQLISEKAIAVFKKFDVDYSFDECVERIQCRTEDLLHANMDLNDAWNMLRSRAGRVSGWDLSVEKIKVSINGQMLLQNLTLNVSKGTGVVIKGSNGAGKTTLLKTILGLVPVNEGQITVGELNVGSKEWRKNRDVVAYVHQEDSKSGMPITAGEVVAMGLAGKKILKKEREHRVEIAMKRMNCFPLMRKNYNTLSGGEKQKVSIARCLCQEARILLLDEPTTFLDPETKKELTAIIADLLNGEAPTIVIVSHDEQWINEIPFKVFELKNGRL